MGERERERGMGGGSRKSVWKGGGGLRGLPSLESACISELIQNDGPLISQLSALTTSDHAHIRTHAHTHKHAQRERELKQANNKV